MRPDRVIVRTAALSMLVGCVVAASTPQSSPWHASSDGDLLQILNERIARGAAVGLVVGALEGGKPRVVASGHRATGQPAAVEGDTVFEIGSVSKVFTTTLLAEMAAQGDVALEDPIRKFLPDSVKVPSRNGREITLLDLATATSGLPRLPNNMRPKDPTNPYADYDVENLHALLSGYTLPRDPGSSYEYSNLGMGLLGHVLALRGGASYEELVTERVLKPLGMTDTRIVMSDAMRARLAVGHGADLRPVSNWDLTALAGAGAWRSTANDMLRFLAAAVTPPQGSLGQAFRMAVEPRRQTSTVGLQIGLGWHILDRNQRRIVWHNGQTGGYHSFIGLDPATSAAIVVLGNAATNIDDIGFHLLDSKAPLRHPAPPRDEVAVEESVLERYVGRYELAPSFAIEVTRDGAALFVQATGQQKFRAYAASPTRFFLRVVEAEIEFTLDESGAVTGLVLHQGGRQTKGRRTIR
jgi:CubicO group peptidase (beta-lactamase class C family)